MKTPIEITVRVFRNGRLIKEVERPVRKLGGEPAVSYRKRLYPLKNQNEIHLDSVCVVTSPLESRSEGKSFSSAARKSGHSELQAAKSAISARIPPSFPGSVAAVPTRGYPTDDDWDDSQREVVTANPASRLLVEAGPGTGKTAVACGRVAHLVRCGVAASNIWLLSFTRTAVKEIRDRISNLAAGKEAANIVKITTLDSHAWYLVQGFRDDPDADPFAGYEMNIAEALRIIQSGNQKVTDYLNSVQHFIVDEGQDFVGDRARLVLALVDELPNTCGITVFGDDAQAIYGFSLEEDRPASVDDAVPLPNRIRISNRGFKTVKLTKVHRTKSESLLKIFSGTRAVVCQAELSPQQRITTVKQQVEEFADSSIGRVLDQHLRDRSDVLVLFRRRAEVLAASDFLYSSGIFHRIRMSGLPNCLYPWVGMILSDFFEKFLTRAEFELRWNRSVARTAAEHGSIDSNWALLMREAGRPAGYVDIATLRKKLGRLRPPVEFVEPDISSSGPILGTVHASKGREAPCVHLMLPPTTPPSSDLDEEARVVFVGATRATTKLLVGCADRCYARRLDGDGRLFQPAFDKKSARIEIGLEGDIDLDGVAGLNTFRSPMEVTCAQAKLHKLIGVSVELVGKKDPKLDYRLKLFTADDVNIGVLSRRVERDIGRAVQHTSRRRVRPPMILNHLHLAGVRTVVVPPDISAEQIIHEPWSRSGFLLAPVVTCFPTMYFKNF